jgi:hypothetical protein
MLDFRKVLERQAEWSERTFGPGERTVAVVKHIRKELEEILQDPNDLVEWIDVMQLAFDGARRMGYSIEAILETYDIKQLKNEERNWPDWRTHPLDEPMEHMR